MGETEREKDTETERETDKDLNSQRQRSTGGERQREGDKLTELREKDTKTQLEKDKRLDRQEQRETGGKRHTERERSRQRILYMLIIVEFRITCHTDFAYIFSILQFKRWRKYFKNKQLSCLKRRGL